MKKYFLLSFLFIILSCNKSSNGILNKNPYLPDYSFSYNINLVLPSYNNLLFAGNAMLIDAAGAGINGFFIIKAGEGDFRAFEASCPNQSLTTCSKMKKNGVNGVCQCDNKEYSLYTGVALGDSSGLYPLKNYRVEVNGDNIRVYN